MGPHCITKKCIIGIPVFRLSAYEGSGQIRMRRIYDLSEIAAIQIAAADQTDGPDPDF